MAVYGYASLLQPKGYAGTPFCHGCSGRSLQVTDHVIYGPLDKIVGCDTDNQFPAFAIAGQYHHFAMRLQEADTEGAIKAVETLARPPGWR